MRCDAVRTFLSQVNDHEEPIAPLASADLDYLSVNGYIMNTSKDDYGKGVDDVARLSQMMTKLRTEHDQEDQAAAALQQDTQKEHSFTFHFEGNEEKVDLRERVQSETTVVSGAESELSATGSIVNELIQEKSMIDRMVACDGGYVSLTDLGMLVLNDLNIRNYRVADQDFPDFVTEIKATYAELRSIADTATSYLIMARPMLSQIEGEEHPRNDDIDDQGSPGVQAPSLLWSVAIGLAKTQGDTNQIADRFTQALGVLHGLDSTIPNKLMAAEIMTVLSNQTIQSLGSDLSDLDKQLRGQAVPKELSAGVAATILAGRRYDGTYPLDRFTQFKGLTSSYEAASILAVMNVPFDGLSSKFATFKGMFNSWGYMISEDTEIASSFLAIGELEADEVEEKLKYIVEQLKNYLEYPLVAAAILASIPAFEAHEVLDLMEKAVTLLSGYTKGLERSELVALAVGMIHGVRNELIREIDPTAKIMETPVPLIAASSSYHAIFIGMGGFHPAHVHGIGGFAG